jgi:hypothetical protein
MEEPIPVLTAGLGVIELSSEDLLFPQDTKMQNYWTRKMGQDQIITYRLLATKETTMALWT